MRVAFCRLPLVVVCIASVCILAEAAPSVEPGKWLTIQLAMVGRRLVVFTSDGSKWYYKTHDLELPDAPAEGHICFQHEEHGNAPGVRFDNVRVWELDNAFDIDKFAAPGKRIGAFRPGSAKLVEDFSRAEIPHFVAVHGDWRVQNRHLWCPGPTSQWARIRTTDTWRDFMLTFKVFRQPSNTTNWAGVGLRTRADGIGAIRLILLSGPAGHRLAVWPTQAKQIESENRAELDRRAKLRAEEKQRLAAAVSRWAEILDAPISAAGELGHDVVLEDVRWKLITARKLGNTLKSHNTFVEPKTTSGFFVLVEIEIENRSKEPLTFLERPLYDQNGRRYSPLSDAMWYFDKEIVWLLKTVNPNVPHKFAQVYEVPKDASRLGVGISNLRATGRKEGIIELGF